MAYDLVVLGATGFTARFVLQEICAQKKWHSGFTWAIAGRQRKALDVLRDSIHQSVTSGPAPDVLVVDIKDYSTVLAMAKQARLVLNCAGPYRHLGEPVVKACIEARADYLDLCGEPEFIESMSLRYHNEATAAGITILHAAAFDSVPCDLGVLQAKRALLARGATPTSVEVFFNFRGSAGFGIHYATYEAAVDGFGGSDKALRDIRKQLAQARPKPCPAGPPFQRKSAVLGISKDARINGFLIRYFFSDPAVVRLTQSLDVLMLTGSPPVHFAAYLVIPSIYALVIMAFYFTIFQFLAVRPWGRQLLLQHPKFFTAGVASKEGPTSEQLAGSSFSQTYFAKGYSSEALAKEAGGKPDVSLTFRLSGAEPGYVATPVIFVRCAIAMLESKDKVRKGVVTPAIAFNDVPLLDELCKDGRIQWNLLSAQ